MKVRSATEGDAQRCSQISGIRSAEELTALLADPNCRWLVVQTDDGDVAGVGIVHIWSWSRVAWVWDLTIDARYRRHGYGKALLAGMACAAREVGAKVLMDFEPTQGAALAGFYVHHGFRMCGYNDRWFPTHKEATAIFYGYDL